MFCVFGICILNIGRLPSHTHTHTVAFGFDCVVFFFVDIVDSHLLFLFTVFNTLFAPRMGITKNVNLEDSRKLMLFSLTFIDQFYLGKNKFIAGDQISIADLSAVCEVSQVLLLGVDLSGYKNLSAWFQKIMAMPEVEKVHQVFFKVLKKLNPEPKF